ncbi:hypothetical protein F5876DRAFT_82459 [Lentinula aff. lateritia]|uniref:Uncharacterized protein n=1 Tax=Lentinula aff. lateritia TaxID=2804960 RepID=A0ACC1TJE2_9AGAR|nr:hypothetical protein F5876DRAFT_82459 [Lentinula aff. lateritia]
MTFASTMKAEEAAKKKAEVVEQRRRLAEAAITRSQRGTSPSRTSASPARPVVKLKRMVKGKGKEQAWAEAIGGDPDDSRDGNDEEQAPCKRCRSKKISCQKQAGKRSSIILSKQRDGPPGEHMAVMESQMAQGLANLRALREAHSRSQQHLLAMASPAALGPSRMVSERLRDLKRRRMVEHSDEEEEEKEEEEEDEASAPKKVKTVASEKGKEQEV